jgi:hypothetical protein
VVSFCLGSDSGLAACCSSVSCRLVDSENNALIKLPRSACMFVASVPIHPRSYFFTDTEMCGIQPLLQYTGIVHKSFLDFPSVKCPTARHSVSSGSAVGIANGYGLDDRGVEVPVPEVSRNLTSPYRSNRLWGAPSLLSNGYRRLFPGVKLQKREADHSPPTSGQVKNTWIHTSI